MSGTRLTYRRAGRALAVSALTAGAALAQSASLASAPAGGGGAGPLTLVRARLHQTGPELRLAVQTTGSFRLSSLRIGSGRSLCVELDRRGARAKQVCVQGKGRPHLVLWEGSRRRRLSGAVRQPAPDAVRLRFRLDDARLRPAPVGWRVTSSWRGAGCPPSGPCSDAMPSAGNAVLRLQTPRVVGCREHGRSFRSHGPRVHKVALTFDDGPSKYTGRVIRTLARFHATATFFAVGVHIAGRQRLLRRMLRAGDEIGNHTFDHVSSSRSSLARASAAIRRATGFRPCLARAPGGAEGGGFIPRARGLHMLTIRWDVDPRDWASQSGVAGRVLSHIHRGAIVVMHDGGGPRGGTAAALPTILRRLRQRHLQATTVTDLIGGRLIWTPR